MRNDRRHGQTVAAFGAAEPSHNNRYLLVDCVAMLIRDKLTKRGMKRKLAAWYVRAFSDQWLQGVSSVEHMDQAILLAVAYLGGETGGPHLGRRRNFLPSLKGCRNRPNSCTRLSWWRSWTVSGNVPKRPASISAISSFGPINRSLSSGLPHSEMRGEKELAQWFKNPPRGPSERERRAFEDVLCTI